MWKSFRLRDCIYDPAGLWLDLLKGAAVSVFFAWFFYRNMLALLVTMPVGGAYILWVQRKKRRKGDREFLIQFKECILSVAASLRAGYAVENAFLESAADMRMMFGADCRIERELRVIRQGLANNVLLEELLREIGARSGEQDIMEFADVFSIAKRNGGSIPEIIGASSHIIQSKLDLAEEVDAILASKRLEQRIMNIAPFALVLYLNAGNPGYFDMLYHNALGIALMTGCMILYLGAFILSEKIFEKAFGQED